MAHSYAEAKAILDKTDCSNLFAVTDLDFHDSSCGETLELCMMRQLPTVVLCTVCNEEQRKMIFSRNGVDYVLKSNVAMDQITQLMKRLYLNRSMKVLIVDDSVVFRKKQAELLKLMQFQVLEAKDGKDAWKQFSKNPEIQLIITDLEMPEMDGLELTSEIRKSFKKEQVAIIGVSGKGDQYTSVQFIKHGANDFLQKPFLQEEFNQRILQTVELVETIKKLHYAANFDFLTGLNNRRYFFERAEQFKKAQKEISSLALMDIDLFKHVNDTFGHDAGDEYLRQFADVLQECIPKPNITARVGGEEFCIFFDRMEEKKIIALLETFRKRIGQHLVTVGEHKISCTVSIGMVYGSYSDLDVMLVGADKKLYQAKNGGRNSLVT